MSATSFNLDRDPRGPREDNSQPERSRVVKDWRQLSLSASAHGARLVDVVRTGSRSSIRFGARENDGKSFAD